MRLFPVLLICFFLSACYTPFAEVQTAENVGKGNLGIGTYGSGMDAISNGNNSDVRQVVIGGQLAYGLADRWDIRGGYGYTSTVSEGFRQAGSFASLGAKYGIIPDRLAFSLPLGVAIGPQAKLSAWQVHPALLYTHPLIQDRLNVTASVKTLVGLEDLKYWRPYRANMAINMGISWKSSNERLSLLAEAGGLEWMNSDRIIGQVSLGLNYRFNLSSGD